MNFYNHNIKQLNFTQQFNNLTHLILSFNQLQNVFSIEHCPGLIVLDLSYNCITNIENLSRLLSLQKLFLHFNQIAQIEDLVPLYEIKNIQELTLRGNPVGENEKEKYDIINNIPSLKVLNDQKINSSDRKPGKNSSLGITDQLLQKSSSIGLRIKSDWRNNIEELNMSYCKLTKIQNLQGLNNLRLLKLSHNKIEKIENLDGCKRLGKRFYFERD